MWDRLNAVDFMNSSMQFAGLAILCLFPVLVILDEATGRQTTHTITTRLGLDHQASKDLDHLINTSGDRAVHALTVFGCIFLALSAIAIASTLQSWYEKVFDESPPLDWKKPLVHRLVWFVALSLEIPLLVLVGTQTGPAGGRVLIFATELVISTLFWWWSIHFLLLGRRRWRDLFPAALTTAICLTGLGVFSALLFSNSVVGNYKSYGPIGVLTVLMSYLIGFGVCLHLGAVIGRLWNEHHPGPDAAPAEALEGTAAGG